MRVHRCVVGVASVILAACSGDPTGPAKIMDLRPSVTESVFIDGDKVVIVSNAKWNLCENLGQADSYCPGAKMQIRWNGQAFGGSGTSFQMDIVWSPSCTWDVPLGHGMCIGQHMEVTFYNAHSFGEHVLLIRKYVLHLN